MDHLLLDLAIRFRQDWSKQDIQVRAIFNSMLFQIV